MYTGVFTIRKSRMYKGGFMIRRSRVYTGGLHDQKEQNVYRGTS